MIIIQVVCTFKYVGTMVHKRLVPPLFLMLALMMGISNFVGFIDTKNLPCHCIDIYFTYNITNHIKLCEFCETVKYFIR